MLQTKIVAALVATWLFPTTAGHTRHLIPVDQCPVVAACCEEDCCGDGTFWDLDTLYCVANPISFGFNGTYSNSFEPGCVERVCCQADCCGDGLKFDEGLAFCVPPPTEPPTTAPTSPITNVTYIMPADSDILSMVEVVELHQNCLDGRNVFLQRFTDHDPPAPFRVMVCPAEEVSKEGNIYKYTLFNNRSITVTCPSDSGISNCDVEGDGLMLDIGEVCWENSDCATYSCIQPTTDDTAPRETRFCTCHPLTYNRGCGEGFTCSYEFTLLPECLLPLGSECLSDESCSTFHCDGATSTCACNKETNYPCNVLRGEICELAEGSYLCLGREPTPAPTSYPILECQPTVGRCVSTFAELESVVAEADNNDVIALCGNGIPLFTESEVIIAKPGMTLCCLGAKDCIMASSGGGRNLFITGSDFTVQDVIFVNGTGAKEGGNVAIDASGNHRILGCEFHNGESPGHTYGGNLAVKNAENLVMKDCLFVNGTAGSSGGGAHLDAKKWTMDVCTFRDNNAGDGGGLHTWDAEEISIKNSVFESNSGWNGAGFFASGLGSLRSLEMLGCTFNNNVAGFMGGAAQMNLASLHEIDLTLSGNSGTGNAAMEKGACPELGFAYREQPYDNTCVGLEDEVFNIARESSL